MRREEELKRDVLKDYFDKENIEKAPEGFTSKVMSHVYMQPRYLKHEKKSPVLYIYAGITAMLVIASLFIPAGTLKFPEISLPQNFRMFFQMGESLKMSPIIYYVIGALILLVVFDSGLKSFFRREKN